MSGGTDMEVVSTAPHEKKEQRMSSHTKFASPQSAAAASAPKVEDLPEELEKVKESIKEATAQNRVFLRQQRQAHLVRLLNQMGNYPQALQTATELIRELKKIDDKHLILEVHLEESKACFGLSSLTKARVALTSARTIANSMYVPPATQAELDMQSGILHAADARDFQTAFSFFYEAFEGFNMINKEDDAMRSLKYMLLCKVMLDKPEDIMQILAHKNTIKYKGSDLDAVCAIGNAAKNRSLSEFNKTFGQYRKELQEDPVVRKHFNALSDTMFEKELSRLIEPYSYVQLAHIAHRIGMPVEKVEKKLAQMILEKKLSGVLHQFDGMIEVYDQEKRDDHAYELSVKMIAALGEIVDTIYTRAVKIQ